MSNQNVFVVSISLQLIADASRGPILKGGRAEEPGKARAGQWAREGGAAQIAAAVLQPWCHRHLGTCQVSATHKSPRSQADLAVRTSVACLHSQGLDQKR